MLLGRHSVLLRRELLNLVIDLRLDAEEVQIVMTRVWEGVYLIPKIAQTAQTLRRRHTLPPPINFTM